MKFSRLSTYLDRLEDTPSRLEITKILSELFEETSKDETPKVCYLILGTLAPNYEGVLLNLAERMMLNVLSICYDENQQKIKLLFKEKGDLGNVAQSLAKAKGDNLSVNEVYGLLLSIAKDGGAGSVERKVSAMAKLLGKLDPLSARFVSRIPVGKLRLGFSEKTIIVALSNGNKDAEIQIEEAYNIRPDIGYIAKLVKENKLESASPEVGVPIVPMLAQRLNSTNEMIDKMGEVAVEPKFDGLRIFIHYRRKGNFLKIFTRNMNAIDEGVFPELKDFGKYIKADEIILDTEAVGLDPKRQMFVDFQKTVSRRRRHEIEKNSTEIPLQFQVFDVLLCDGKNFLRMPYTTRRKEIEKVVVNGSLLKVDEYTITKDPEVIKKFHQKYLKMGLEGVVVKRASGLYVSGRTGWNWVKMKEEEGMKGRLSDTLDCIVMGYFTGKGKRAQFGLGKILVGIRDGEKIRTLTKVGTGLTEEMLVEIRKRIDKLESKEKPKEYEAQKDLVPDVWAHPSLVVEVSADSVSVSTKHSLGLSLRFPRFLKIRGDKSTSQATTLKELQNIAGLK
ncbi:MAG: ATP-dependent DNA ligase [Patescibacteria group bacterium]